MPTPLVVQPNGTIQITNESVSAAGSPVTNPDYTLQPPTFDSTFFTPQHPNPAEVDLVSTGKTGNTAVVLSATSTTVGDTSPVSTSYAVTVPGPVVDGVTATFTVVPPAS